MKLGNTCLVVMAAVLCLCLTAGTALAADKAQVLQQAYEKIKILASESSLRETMDNVGLFKKAGKP